MPRVLIALRKLSPVSSRFPSLWEVLGVTLRWLTSFGYPEMALSLLVMFTGYLRPSEVMWFRIQRRVTKDAKKEFKSPLSTFLIHPLRQMVDKCVTAPIIPEGFSLYMLRHGGVTSGVLPENRERLAARTRGRWLSDVMPKKCGTPGLTAKFVLIGEHSVNFVNRPVQPGRRSLARQVGIS